MQAGNHGAGDLRRARTARPEDALSEGLCRSACQDENQKHPEEQHRRENIYDRSANLEFGHGFERTQPLSELELLERELHKAVEAEQFERAASLRDQIRLLRAER